MTFRLIAALLLCFCSTFAFADPVSQPQDLPISFHADVERVPNATAQMLNLVEGVEGTVFSAACCKTCRKGKACGDSCISRSYTCRKGVGCACDG